MIKARLPVIPTIACALGRSPLVAVVGAPSDTSAVPVDGGAVAVDAADVADTVVGPFSAPTKKKFPATGSLRFTETANVVRLNLVLGVEALTKDLAVSAKSLGWLYTTRT